MFTKAKRGGTVAINGYGGAAVERDLDEAVALADDLIAESKAISLKKQKGKPLGATLESAQAQFDRMGREYWDGKKGGGSDA